MTLTLWFAIGGLFLSIALLTGMGVQAVIASRSDTRRRLRELVPAGTPSTLLVDQVRLTEQVDPTLKKIADKMPKSPKEMSRLRRRLGTAGITSFRAAVFYSAAELILPVLVGGAFYRALTPPMAYIFGVIGAFIGYMVPSLVLERLIHLHKRKIENGLPDALDLMVVCVESGSGLDQAIQKTATELEIAHPELAAELKLITTEVRAGKPRIEAFKNFASRTKVDDVRALVAMLVQTDRFGTSVAQALRTHATVSRTKRRQRAEEKAAKIGVKLVFPLVFCLFPSLYVAILGPAVVDYVRVFKPNIVQGSQR